MSVQRWSPWRDIAAMQEAMDEAIREPFRWFPLTGDRSIEIDLQETDDSYIVKADIPGCDPEDIDVSLHQNMLRMSATRKREEDGEVRRWLVRERRSGHFERAIALPEPVRADQVTADCTNGVLTVTMPKREDVKPRTIQVRQAG